MGADDQREVESNRRGSFPSLPAAVLTVEIRQQPYRWVHAVEVHDDTDTSNSMVTWPRAACR
jgi:hypothetical protein